MSDEVLRSKRSAELRAAVDEAYRDVQQAHAQYYEALAIMTDTPQSTHPDGALALRQGGREYAHVVRRYSDAVMAWISHVETNREKAVKLLRKEESAGK